MDKFAPELIRSGLKGMIGKGDRSAEVVCAMKECNAVYFAAIGGIGAYIAATIQSHEVIAYEELGAEAIHKLTVKDFPLIVAIDSRGNNLYHTEPQIYKGRFSQMADK
jgi:fumarate hydratase subunit beta